MYDYYKFLPRVDDGVDDDAGDGDNDVPYEVDGCRLTSRFRISCTARGFTTFKFPYHAKKIYRNNNTKT